MSVKNEKWFDNLPKSKPIERERIYACSNCGKQGTDMRSSSMGRRDHDLYCLDCMEKPEIAARLNERGFPTYSQCHSCGNWFGGNLRIEAGTERKHCVHCVKSPEILRRLHEALANQIIAAIKEQSAIASELTAQKIEETGHEHQSQRQS